VAGAFSLEDGLKLVAHRGRLMQSMAEQGAMAAVYAGNEQIGRVMDSVGTTACIAALNGPENTVIAGARAEIDAALLALRDAGIEARSLPVSRAFHSPLVEPMLDEFERAAASVAFSAPHIHLVSNVTGRLIEGDEIRSAAYWRRHAREPVRFEES